MINPTDFMKISHDLEKHHSVFYLLWEMGTPIFTDSIPTSAISFDHEGHRVGFLFNPKFCERLSEYERQFIICHECMHVILNHGCRISGMPQSTLPVANVALDIVVNHLLVDRFGFKREDLSIGKELCWIDTVFPKPEDIEKDQYFEYYFKKMIKQANISMQSLADNHDSLEVQGESIDEIIDHLNDTLSDGEKHSLKETVEKHFVHKKDEDKEETGRGTQAGGMWTFANVSNVKIKKKWETVIKKWSQKFLTEFSDKEQWARINRRFAAISSDMFLPSEMEEEDHSDPKKIKVWFFQDTSGSCRGLKDRFFRAAMSLPPKRFDVKMHCFDTKVYETDLKSKKLYGFGGTSFDIIESYIQRHLKGEEYPTVFLVTDGFGNKVSPQMPEKWYWFLTGSYRSCIPGECNIYKLSDYE
jgi:predicted metal-dependent peptidase